MVDLAVDSGRTHHTDDASVEDEASAAGGFLSACFQLKVSVSKCMIYAGMRRTPNEIKAFLLLCGNSLLWKPSNYSRSEWDAANVIILM